MYFISSKLSNAQIDLALDRKEEDLITNAFMSILENDNRMSENAKRAFFEDYRDNRGGGYKYMECLEGFLNRLVQLYQPIVYYSPITSLIQSSGMGKSRSFKELAKKYLAFYVVFRVPGESGFPSGCRPVIDYLMFNALGNAPVSPIADIVVVRRYIAFLKACTDVALSVASKKKELSSDFFERFFLIQVSENVDQFWEDIMESAKNYETKMDISKYSSVNRTYIHDFIKDQQYSAISLNRLNVLSRNPLKLLIVLDEVHCLFGGKQKLRNEHLFFNFVRALQVFDNFKGIICATADTMSKLSDLIPVSEKHISDRVANKGQSLFPPFYRIGTVDCNVEDDEIGYLTLDQIEEKERITKYGRPLWWSLLRSGDELSKIVDLATEKLLGLASSFDNTEKTCLAILGSRLQFAERPSFSLASELAASHLAVVDYISSKRDVMFISYTSEPVVAEAAAVIMKDRIADILRTLKAHFTSQFVERGLRSEYIARLVCLLAADKVSRGLPIKTGEFIYNRLISCNDYLTQLVGADLPLLIDPQIRGIDFSRFRQGKIYLTHFIGCTYEPSLGDLVSFFERGAGVLCKTNQTGIDMIIPVLLPPSPEVSDSDFVKIARKTVRTLDLARTAKTSKHDGYDIPQSLLPFEYITLEESTPNPHIATSSRIIDLVKNQALPKSPRLRFSGKRIREEGGPSSQSSHGSRAKRMGEEELSQSISESGGKRMMEEGGLAEPSSESSKSASVLVSPTNMSYILIQVFCPF